MTEILSLETKEVQEYFDSIKDNLDIKKSSKYEKTKRRYL